MSYILLYIVILFLNVVIFLKLDTYIMLLPVNKHIRICLYIVTIISLILNFLFVCNVMPKKSTKQEEIARDIGPEIIIDIKTPIGQRKSIHAANGAKQRVKMFPKTTKKLKPPNSTVNSKRHCDDALLKTGDHWQRVTNTEPIFSYVYSAFLEPTERQVKVLGIQHRNHSLVYSCWFVQEITKTVVKVKGQGYLMRDHHYKTFGAVIITCKIPKKIYGHITGVGITTSSHIKPNNYMNIHLPGKQFTRNFTVCASVLHSRYKDVHSLLESLAYYRSVGVDHVVMHVQSTTLAVNTVLNYYRKLGFLTYLDFQVPVEDVHYFAQLVAINDCVFRSRGFSRFVAITDLDELVVPYHHSDWFGMTKSLLSKHPKSSAFLFRNVFIDMRSPDANDNNSQSVTIRNFKLKRLLRKWRDNFIFKAGNRSKILLRPETVNHVGIHRCELISFKSKFTCVNVSPNIALLHHYKTSVKVTSRLNDTTIRKLTNTVVKYLNETLITLGMCNLGIT